jgi:hypothetical protein
MIERILNFSAFGVNQESIDFNMIKENLKHINATLIDTQAISFDIFKLLAQNRGVGIINRL